VFKKRIFGVDFNVFRLFTRCPGMIKMDTIGDAYIVATLLPPCTSLSEAGDVAGCTSSFKEQLQAACKGALEVARAMLEAMEEHQRITGSKLQCRIGLSVGPVVAGVIGRLQVHYSFFETVGLLHSLVAACTLSVAAMLPEESI
jgi:class 3 adenylate cyclase